MKREIGLLIALVLLLLLVACNGGGVEPPAAGDESDPVAGEAPEETPEVEPTEAPVNAAIDDYESLVEALRAAGLEVEASGAIEDPFFDVETQLLTTADTRIELFQFEDEAAAEEAASTINASGTIIGTTTVDWIEPPHFYRQGRLLVLYAGTDETVLAALSHVLGEPFVVGQTMGLPPTESEVTPTAES